MIVLRLSPTLAVVASDVVGDNVSVRVGGDAPERAEFAVNVFAHPDGSITVDVIPRVAAAIAHKRISKVVAFRGGAPVCELGTDEPKDHGVSVVIKKPS